MSKYTDEQYRKKARKMNSRLPDEIGTFIVYDHATVEPWKEYGAHVLAHVEQWVWVSDAELDEEYKK